MNAKILINHKYLCCSCTFIGIIQMFPENIERWLFLLGVFLKDSGLNNEYTNHRNSMSKIIRKHIYLHLTLSILCLFQIPCQFLDMDPSPTQFVLKDIGLNNEYTNHRNSMSEILKTHIYLQIHNSVLMFLLKISHETRDTKLWQHQRGQKRTFTFIFFAACSAASSFSLSSWTWRFVSSSLAANWLCAVVNASWGHRIEPGVHTHWPRHQRKRLDISIRNDGETDLPWYRESVAKGHRVEQWIHKSLESQSKTKWKHLTLPSTAPSVILLRGWFWLSVLGSPPATSSESIPKNVQSLSIKHWFEVSGYIPVRRASHRAGSKGGLPSAHGDSMTLAPSPSFALKCFESGSDPYCFLHSNVGLSGSSLGQHATSTVAIGSHCAR